MREIQEIRFLIKEAAKNQIGESNRSIRGRRRGVDKRKFSPSFLFSFSSSSTPTPPPKKKLRNSRGQRRHLRAAVHPFRQAPAPRNERNPLLRPLDHAVSGHGPGGDPGRHRESHRRVPRRLQGVGPLLVRAEEGADARAAPVHRRKPGDDLPVSFLFD